MPINLGTMWNLTTEQLSLLSDWTVGGLWPVYKKVWDPSR